MRDLSRAAGWTRRRVLGRVAMTAAAVTAGSAALSACASSSAGNASSSTSAAPAAQFTGITLHFQTNNQGGNFDKTRLSLFQGFVDDNFSNNPKYKGIRAVIDPAGWGNPSGQITASIAGSGYNDVLHSCCSDLVTYQSGGWLTPLDDYLRRDNIATSAWNKGHVDVLTFDGKLMALPSYDGPGVIAYRQDILDDLGLPYPDASWTWQQATDLWTRCSLQSKKTNKWQYGVSPYMSGHYEWMNFWVHAFGGQEMTPDRQTCLLDKQPGVAALDYMATNIKNKVFIDRVEVGGLVSGQCVFSYNGGWNVLPLAMQLGTKYKWDILPTPNWANGRATFCNIDFYAINSATKHPDESWLLMEWLTHEPDYQRFQMKSTLVQPCLISLFDEWEALVKSVAPPLQNKQLQWFKDAVVNGYGYPTIFFKYAPNQTDNLIDSWWTQITTGKVSPQEGATQMANQVNQLQQAAAAEAAAGVQNKAKFPTQGPDVAAVPVGI